MSAPFPTDARPDYQAHGLVNLMASLLAAFDGGTTGYHCTPQLMPTQIGTYRNVVLLVLDGVGHAYLSRKPDSFLNRHLHGQLSSVFPPTTAAAIPVFLTGLAPQQHGLTGWFTWFKEIATVTAVLPLRARGSQTTLVKERGLDPKSLLVGESVFNRMQVDSFSLAPRYIARSDFNRHYHGRARVVDYRDIDELTARLIQCVQSNRRRKYVYAYYPDWDACAHSHGVYSGQSEQLFERMDRAIESMVEKLRGTRTLLMVTADHGFIDLLEGGYSPVDQHPQLADCLSLPLCGEPRAAYCYVRAEREQAFVDYCQQHLSDVAWLRRSADLLAEGWFGLGTPHPRLHERIGDYVLLARPGHAIKDWLISESHYQHRGVHGGIDAAEMTVPLVVVESG